MLTNQRQLLKSGSSTVLSTQVPHSNTRSSNSELMPGTPSSQNIKCIEPLGKVSGWGNLKCSHYDIYSFWKSPHPSTLCVCGCGVTVYLGHREDEIRRAGVAQIANGVDKGIKALPWSWKYYRCPQRRLVRSFVKRTFRPPKLIATRSFVQSLSPALRQKRALHW